MPKLGRTPTSDLDANLDAIQLINDGLVRTNEDQAVSEWSDNERGESAVDRRSENS